MSRFFLFIIITIEDPLKSFEINLYEINSHNSFILKITLNLQVIIFFSIKKFYPLLFLKLLLNIYYKIFDNFKTIIILDIFIY